MLDLLLYLIYLSLNVTEIEDLYLIPSLTSNSYENIISLSLSLSSYTNSGLNGKIRILWGLIWIIPGFIYDFC